MDSSNGKRMFLSDDWLVSDTLQLYTDAASAKGFASLFGTKWFMHAWPEDFQMLHINILMLFPIILAVEIWGEKMSDQRILFLSDNEATVFVLNKMSSKDPVMMKLVRRLVLAAMRYNIMFRSKHVPGKTNYDDDNPVFNYRKQTAGTMVG